jgi:hypothetical protein
MSALGRKRSNRYDQAANRNGTASATRLCWEPESNWAIIASIPRIRTIVTRRNPPYTATEVITMNEKATFSWTSARDRLREQREMFLSGEVSQAWTHYRHIEETRTKYLSFFATVVLGSSGFLITVLKDLKNFDPIQLVVSLSIFVLFLFLFSFFIWANIVRMGFVLSAYDQVIQEARSRTLSEEVALNLNIRTKIPNFVSKGIFRVQLAASSIVLGVCVLLCAGEVYLGYLAGMRLPHNPAWLGELIEVAAAFQFLFVAYAIVRTYGTKGKYAQ